MPRFLVTPSHVRGKSFLLTGSEAHHALHVLRKKVGDEIDLFDGKDASYRGRIDAIEGGDLRGTLLENLVSTAWPVRVVLYQALSRGSKWEWMLEKAGEIGVAQIVPVITRRTLIKWDSAQSREKVERWNRIALAATKQSGRSDIMEVTLPQLLPESFEANPANALRLIPWEKENARSIHQATQGFKGKEVHVFIGPEGGWESSEVEQAQRANVIPVKLGPTLLRTETAGLIATTLVLREFGVY